MTGDNNQRGMITHVCFDLDGLLIDTEPVYTKAHTLALKHFGKQFTVDLKQHTMGMKHEKAIRLLHKMVGLSDTVTVKAYDDIYRPILFEHLPNCPKMPGAMKVVKYFAAQTIDMAIVTGSSNHTFKLKTMHHQDLIDLIPLHVKSSDDPEIKESKPSPEPFLVALRRFERPPSGGASNVLVFEDSANGVLSAVAAGMQVIMVPDHNYSKPPDQVKNQILQVLDSLEDFQPETLGFPPYQS